MINPSLYEEYFMKGIEVLTEDFGSELVKKQVERFYLNTFVDDEKDALKNSIASFQKKDWHELKENIHVLKGRFFYMEMESFSVFFVKLKKSCEDGNTCEIQTFFPEAMKIMTWIHERTMKFLNIEAVNVFKVDPAIFENLSKDVQASNCQNIEKEVENCDKKKIFDKEYYLKTCHDDEMQSKFKMYALIDDLFKDGTGLLYEIKKSFERNQINETLSQLKFILEKIKKFGFNSLENSLKEALKKDSKLENTFLAFLEECYKLNKVLQENYSLDDDCIFENKSNKQMNKNSPNALNKVKLKEFENFKISVFSKEGKIMKLIKFYEESNYEKMKEELDELEKLTTDIGFSNFVNAIKFLNKACFLNNSDDVQKYIKLLCQESHRTLIFITESLHIKNESFINYEELLSKIKLGNKYKNVDLSKIPEIDDEKTSDKQDKIPSFSSKISRDASEIIKKSKRCDETDYNNDSNGNIDEEDNESSLLDKNYKSMKFNVFPGPTIRNLSEIGSDIKNFQLYYMKEYKDEDYPFDSGLKCNII